MHTGEHPQGQEQGHEQHQDQSGYRKLAVALTLSLIAMYVLTMAFVAEAGHFYLNLSNGYMAVLMVAPMGIIMMVVMRGMFPNKALNTSLIAGFALLFVAVFFIGRQQAGVGNDQFLRAMIPHHSRAILVCQEANITDQDIAELCDEIIQTQREEIATMEVMLED